MHFVLGAETKRELGLKNAYDWHFNFYRNKYSTCLRTHTLTVFLLPRDAWVAKQQHGVLEKKKSPEWKLMVGFWFSILNTDHS